MVLYDIKKATVNNIERHLDIVEQNIKDLSPLKSNFSFDRECSKQKLLSCIDNNAYSYYSLFSNKTKELIAFCLFIKAPHIWDSSLSHSVELALNVDSQLSKTEQLEALAQLMIAAENDGRKDGVKEIIIGVYPRYKRLVARLEVMGYKHQVSAMNKKIK